MKVRTLTLHVYLDVDDQIIGVGPELVAPVAVGEIGASMYWAIRTAMLFPQPRPDRDDLEEELSRVYGEVP